MARSLEQLKKQYSHSASGKGPRGPMMGGPGRGPRGPMGRGPGGKPKNLKKTIGRLLSYVGKQKALLIVVFLFMLVNTVTSLVGGYMTRPIINRIIEISMVSPFCIYSQKRL